MNGVVLHREKCRASACAARDALRWLLRETYEPQLLTEVSSFSSADAVVEVGPRLSFASAFSSNAVSIARNSG